MLLKAEIEDVGCRVGKLGNSWWSNEGESPKRLRVFVKSKDRHLLNMHCRYCPYLAVLEYLLAIFAAVTRTLRVFRRHRARCDLRPRLLPLERGVFVCYRDLFIKESGNHKRLCVYRESFAYICESFVEDECE